MMSATNIPHRIRTKAPSPSSFAIRAQHIVCYLAVNPRRSPIARDAISNPSAAPSMQCRLREARTRNVRPRSLHKQRKRPIRSLEWTSLPRRRESARPPRESWAGLDRRGHSAHNVFGQPPLRGGVLILRRLACSSVGQWPNGERHQYHKNQNAAQAPASVFHDRKRGH